MNPNDCAAAGVEPWLAVLNVDDPWKPLDGGAKDEHEKFSIQR